MKNLQKAERDIKKICLGCQHSEAEPHTPFEQRDNRVYSERNSMSMPLFVQLKRIFIPWKGLSCLHALSAFCNTSKEWYFHFSKHTHFYLHSSLIQMWIFTQFLLPKVFCLVKWQKLPELLEHEHSESHQHNHNFDLGDFGEQGPSQITPKLFD